MRSAFFCSRVPAVCREPQESGCGRSSSLTVRNAEAFLNFRMSADCPEKTMTCCAERRKQKGKVWIFLIT